MAYCLLFLFIPGCGEKPGHPRIYISEKGKASFTRKLETAEWARESFDKIKSGVEQYVDRHQTDPEWIISRMQMYWDTHYERVYVKGNFFSHGTGRAPVPTVKFAGARDWETDYVMPSLEDTRPYMDEQGMYLQNMKKEGHPWEWVHPSKTGRIIGPMNDRIMALAADAAFLYWYTGEEKYAVFASDIFLTYIKGMHYRREPFALENYGNSHLMGLATFEVILDHLIPHMAVCYDFLHGYLKDKNADFDMIINVFKRFADQQIMYGVPDNNWNIFQARHVIYLALALENDQEYADGRGRQYYIDQIFNHTTIRQFALKEAIVDLFDPETGLWPESATYSMSVCKDMLDIICLIDNAENNHMLDSFPIMKKAVPATVEYLFPNGRVTAFGDAKYVPLKAQPFEMMVALYRKYGDVKNEKDLTRVLRKMIDDSLYSRSDDKSMFSLFFHVDRLMDLPAGEAGYSHLMADFVYAPNVSWLIQRNGKDKQNGMVVTLTGSYGNHAHANGISMEMYGKGLILAPESSFGVSYGSRDNQEYYARFPSHNTVIVDGISDYGMMRSNDPYTLLSSYPAPADTLPEYSPVTFARVAFTEPKTDAKQERLTSIIRQGPSNGYVVDIFRSARNNGKDLKHEYLYHSLGQSIDIMSADQRIMPVTPTKELGTASGDLKGYDYFTNKKALKYDRDFMARFHIKLEKEDPVYVNMWMKGYPGRTLFTVESPKSNALVSGSVPDELLDKPLPTLIVRQDGEAWDRPFVAIYHPYTLSEGPSVQSVQYFGQAGDHMGIVIRSGNGSDYIFNSSKSQSVRHLDMQFEGSYAVVSRNNDVLNYLFLGEGKSLEAGDWGIVSKSNAQASVSVDGKNIMVHTTGDIELNIPGTEQAEFQDSGDSGKKYRTGLRDGKVSVSLPAGTYHLTQ